MMKKLILVLMALYLTTPKTLLAENESKMISKKELKMIEDRVQSELGGKILDDKKKFFLNLLAGRELYQYRFFDKAETYYRNALNIKVDENKSEAYINLMAIGINRGDKEKVKIVFNEAHHYFGKNPSYKTSEISYYLTTIENYLPNKTGKVPVPVQGFYGRFAHEENLINLIKNKDYQKAMSLLNPESLKSSTNDFNITVYDSLNVYLNKKNVKELFCDKQYKQYPNSFATSTILCSLLNDYLHEGKFSEQHLKKANLYFTENSENKYLFELVKEIK